MKKLDEKSLTKINDILKYPEEHIGMIKGIKREMWLFDQKDNQIINF